MSDDDLPTELWVMAGIRRCSDRAVPAVVVRRGAAGRGTVVLRLSRPGAGVRVLTQGRDLHGRRAWLPALDGAEVADAEANAYIRRTVDRDPDVWVVEIEHRDGWHPFGGHEL